MAPSLELAVHHVGPTILGGVIFYPGGQAAQVVAGWREAIAHAPDELTSMINLTAAPPLPFLPEAVHGKRVAVVIACYAGASTAAKQQSRPYVVSDVCETRGRQAPVRPR
jgi:hypothetical protein